MQGFEGFSLPEVILGILFFMLKNDLRTLTGHKSGRAV